MPEVVRACVHACTLASVCLRACVYACVCVHVCPSNTVPNNLWLPPSLVFYQSALSNHYSHLCLSANMLFPPSLFPPPQRDKVKECCISTSKLNSSMLSECFFFPPLWHHLLSSAEWKRHFAVDFLFIFFACVLLPGRRQSGLTPLTESVLWWWKASSLQAVTVPAFPFVLLPSNHLNGKEITGREREREKMKEATAVSLSRVLTPSQVPLHSPSSPPLSSPSLPSPCLLLWPISAEQWSVKKFPISKFTHCINLV